MLILVQQNSRNTKKDEGKTLKQSHIQMFIFYPYWDNILQWLSLLCQQHFKTFQWQGAFFSKHILLVFIWGRGKQVNSIAIFISQSQKATTDTHLNHHGLVKKGGISKVISVFLQYPNWLVPYCSYKGVPWEEGEPYTVCLY